jgi:hypothetical protein
MGFGSSVEQTVTGLPLIIQTTSFSFSIPKSGVLFNFEVSVDILLLRELSANQNFIFTLIRSASTNGTMIPANPYTSTGYTATVTFTQNFVATVYTASQINIGSIAVSPGDRIVVQVTPNPSPIDSAVIMIAMTAGLSYSPT